MPAVFLTLRFDEETERAIRDLWKLLGDGGIDEAVLSRHRPHITTAAYETGDLSAVCAALPGLTARRAAIPLPFHSVDVFVETGTVFLAPRMTSALMSAHRDLHESASSAWGPSLYPEHLQPNAWAPHCTLATRLSLTEVASAITLCMDHLRPIDGSAETIGVLVPPATSRTSVNLRTASFNSMGTMNNQLHSEALASWDTSRSLIKRLFKR